MQNETAEQRLGAETQGEVYLLSRRDIEELEERAYQRAREDLEGESLRILRELQATNRRVTKLERRQPLSLSGPKTSARVETIKAELSKVHFLTFKQVRAVLGISGPSMAQLGRILEEEGSFNIWSRHNGQQKYIALKEHGRM